MALIKLNLKRMEEGDGNYFIAENGQILHKKGKPKFIARFKAKRTVYVKLCGGERKEQKIAVATLLKKYWNPATQ